MKLFLKKIDKNKREELSSKYQDIHFGYNWVTTESEDAFFVQNGGWRTSEEKPAIFIMYYKGEFYYIAAYEKYKDVNEENDSINIRLCWKIQKGNKNIWNRELEILAERMLYVWTKDQYAEANYEEMEFEWEN